MLTSVHEEFKSHSHYLIPKVHRSYKKKTKNNLHSFFKFDFRYLNRCAPLIGTSNRNPPSFTWAIQWKHYRQFHRIGMAFQ